MAALTKATSKGRVFRSAGPSSQIQVQVEAGAKIFLGAACSLPASTPLGVAPLVATEAFMGFAMFEAQDNTGGAAGDLTVELVTAGVLEAEDIATAVGSADLGAPVFMLTDNDFTLVLTAATEIGTVASFNPDTGKFGIAFRAATSA